MVAHNDQIVDEVNQVNLMNMIVLTNHFKLSYGKSKCLMSFAHCAICISYKIFQGMLVNSYPKDGFHMDSISLFLFALKISNIVMFMNYEPRL